MEWLAIFIGGGLGSIARYASGLGCATLLGKDFPYGTLFVNILGSFIILFFMTLAMDKLTISPTLRLFIVTGILGGFTTYSSFTFETLNLAINGEPGKALLNVGLTIILGLTAGISGVILARLV